MPERQSIGDIIESFRRGGVDAPSQGQEVGKEQLGTLRASETPAMTRPANDTPSHHGPEHGLGGPYQAPSLGR